MYKRQDEHRADILDGKNFNNYKEIRVIWSIGRLFGCILKNMRESEWEDGKNRENIEREARVFITDFLKTSST